MNSAYIHRLAPYDSYWFSNVDSLHSASLLDTKFTSVNLALGSYLNIPEEIGLDKWEKTWFQRMNKSIKFNGHYFEINK